MESGEEYVDVICPRCKARQKTVLDPEEPAETAVVEIPCPECGDADESLSMEPVFRDKAGVRLF